MNDNNKNIDLDLLLQYLYGELTPEQQNQVDKILDQDEKWAEVYEGLSQFAFDNFLYTRSSFDAAFEIEQLAVQKKLEKILPNSKPAVKYTISNPLLKWAAILILPIAAIGVWWYVQSSMGGTTGITPENNNKKNDNDNNNQIPLTQPAAEGKGNNVKKIKGQESLPEFKVDSTMLADFFKRSKEMGNMAGGGSINSAIATYNTYAYAGKYDSAYSIIQPLLTHVKSGNTGLKKGAGLLNAYLKADAQDGVNYLEESVGDGDIEAIYVYLSILTRLKEFEQAQKIYNENKNELDKFIKNGKK